eukprot:CAMPEP_0118663898 /NCGR_PEP_ID=MMETSP0785-20121206/17701_1 /TAXON_ID=91992 /ORGANISM="Bolidomonas pacifica, Strain CCMP 1866" /LENGTH=309 /DNA_ID=CAMNT_0006557721 /DNA_START=117 /DNA_END=1044 /DNA_ORIENTATION=-
MLTTPTMFEARYRAAAPLPRTLEAFRQMRPDHTSKEASEVFAQIIKFVKPYSPSPRYTLQLLQQYSREVEREGGVIESDLFAEVLFEALKLAKDTEEADPLMLQYLTFKLGIGQVAVRTGPYHNDVGLRQWEAGYLLVEFLIKNPSYVRNKSVIELGAGIGLTGIVIQGFVARGVRDITLTDYTDVTLANMNHNVALNAPWIEQNNPGSPLPKISHLDWEEVGGSKSSSCCAALSSSEVLLAADVVYDVDVLPHLTKVVRLFLLSEKAEVAIFATTLRNESTFNLFIECLKKENVQYQELIDYEHEEIF